MKNNQKVYVYTLAAAVLALVTECVYPTVFIRWLVPLYAVCVAAMAAAAFLLFLALNTAKNKPKPVLRSVVGCAAYTAVLMGVTPLVNNVIFGAVAPWGSVLVNAALNLVFWLVMLRLIRKASGEPFVWKPLLCLLLVLAGLPVTALTAAPNMKATGFIVLDTVANYEKRISTIDIYDNTLETAVPQTQVYNIILSHLTSALPEGKTEKKVLVLGWDGCRADAMALTETRAAVDTLLAEGGRAAIAYCGGVNYPAPITQDTSTVPGWSSMLTGVWAAENGLIGNSEKTLDHPTLLVSAIEDGLIDSSAFYFSWTGHPTTYAKEIAYTGQKGLPVTWEMAESGDEGTLANALADLQQADCSDFIFTIFEFCDEYGHGSGFWNDNPEYAAAFAGSNQTGMALIDAVRARPTYKAEDWLILITSDHGGYVRGHGGTTLQERMMFIITNKPW